MVQIINDPYSGNAFGRIGKGLGQALSEQVPKEVERLRLASGLKKLEQEKDLDPFQFFTRAATLPGASPQLIETLGKLSKQRLQGEALNKFGKGGEKTDRFPELPGQNMQGDKESSIPSLTTRTPVEATLNPYIPKSYTEIQKRAAELFNSNPNFFQNDPQQAIQAAQQEDQQEQSINSVLQGQRSNEQNVQSTVISSLRNQHNLLENNVPSEVYSKIEDEAIQAVKSIKDGGRGITEQQAAKEFGAKLAEISKDYSALDALGKWTLITKKPKETASAIKSLQTKAAKRKELEPFANTLIAKNGLSPQLAYSLAYPISENKNINQLASRLPKIINDPYKYKNPEQLKEFSAQKTREIAPQLVEKLGESSPLSIAQYLQNKGYDAEAWIDYLRDHRNEIDLSERQGRELDKSTSFVPPLNDIFLTTFGGL